MQNVQVKEHEAIQTALQTATPPKRLYSVRQDKWKKAAKGILLPVLTLIIWEIAGTAGQISPTVLPTPHVIAQEFYHLARSGELFFHLSISVWRSFLGFLLGGSVGLALGLWSGFSRLAEKQLDPSIQMLRTVPHLVITPLFILWFGFGEVSKILLIALGAFFPVYVNTFLGIRSVDTKLFEVAKVLEYNRRSQITRLILPASLPNILLGIRLSLGAAWLGLVVAEMMGSSEGVGFLIMDARYFSITSLVFVGILIFAFVGKLTDSLVKLLEKRLLRWRDSYLGDNL